MQYIDKCPICKSTDYNLFVDKGDTEYILNCQICGRYRIDISLANDTSNLMSHDDLYMVSGVLRELDLTGIDLPYITNSNLHEFMKHNLVPDLNDPSDKAKKLIKQMRKRSNYYGAVVDLHYSVDYPLAYAKNEDEMEAIVRLLVNKGLFENTDKYSVRGSYRAILTAEAWDVANKINKIVTDSSQAFIATWFDDSMDDSIVAIEQAVLVSGYKPVCIKYEKFSEKIIDKALNEIRKSKFVVVDLTGGRNSVFFEAGFAVGLELECIYVFKKNTEINNNNLEFYVKHYQCYQYESGDELKELLVNAIGARIPKDKDTFNVKI